MGKMYVKAIADPNFYELVNCINNFLETTEDELIDIKYPGRSDDKFQNYTALIILREDDNE